MTLDDLRARVQPAIDQLGDAWAALPEERRRRLRPLLLLTALALPLLMIVLPLVRARLDAGAELASAREQLDEMRRLETIVVQRGLGEKTRPEGPAKGRKTSLLSTVDGMARKLRIQTLVQAVRPVGGRGGDEDEAVEIQLKGLVLEELLKLLYALEVEHDNLSVRKLELSRELKTPRELRATLEVAQR